MKWGFLDSGEEKIVIQQTALSMSQKMNSFYRLSIHQCAFNNCFVHLYICWHLMCQIVLTTMKTSINETFLWKKLASCGGTYVPVRYAEGAELGDQELILGPIWTTPLGQKDGSRDKKCLSIKPDNLSSAPQNPHRGGRRGQLHRVVSDPCMHMYIHHVYAIRFSRKAINGALEHRAYWVSRMECD